MKTQTLLSLFCTIIVVGLLTGSNTFRAATVPPDSVAHAGEAQAGVAQAAPTAPASSLNFGAVRSVALDNGYMYVGNTNGIFWVVNIQDPLNPVVESQMTLPGSVNGITGAEQFAAVAYGSISSYNGSVLQLIDISDPRNPKIRGTFQTIDTSSMTFTGSSIYVGGSRLTILDRSNPDALVVQSTYTSTIGTTSPIEPKNIYRIRIKDNIAYMSIRTYSSFVEIVDISDPSSPRFLSSISIPMSAIVASITDLQIYGNILLVTEGYCCYRGPYQQGNLYIVDVTNPKQPIRRGRYRNINLNYQNIRVYLDRVYLINNQEADIIDISNPDAPKLQEVVGWSSPRFPMKVELNNPYFYLFDSDGNLTISPITKKQHTYVPLISKTGYPPPAN